MGSDDEAADARVARERDLERHGSTASASALIEDMSDGLSGEGAALVGVGEREVEVGRSELIEEPEQAAGRSTEVTAV